MKTQSRPQNATPDKDKAPKPDVPIEPKADNEDLDRDYDLQSPAHKPPEDGQTPETEVSGP